MTEEKKRQLALQLMLEEQQRHFAASIIPTDRPDIQRRISNNQALFSSLSQQGITWQQLKAAYDSAYDEGRKAMLDHHLSFLYAGAAIAYKETFNTVPEKTADFVKRLALIPDEIPSWKDLVRKAKELTGIETTRYDDPGQPPILRGMPGTNSNASKKDRDAVARMRRTGITEEDLSYEKQLGYTNGWNSGFYFSACYAAVALALYEYGQMEQAEELITRLEELRYEEISTADIISRAIRETDVDISNMIR